MDLNTLLNHIAATMRWAVRFDYNGEAHVEITTTPGRTQVVHVMPGFDPENEHLVYVWSAAGDLQAARDPWALLRHSISLSYGCVAVKDNAIVVKHSMRLVNADEVALRKAIYYVGRAADELEAQAYGYADRL